MQMSSQGDDDDTPKSQQHHHVSFAIAAGSGSAGGGSAGGGNHESSPPGLERARGGSGTAQPLSAIDPGDQVSSRRKDGTRACKIPRRAVCLHQAQCSEQNSSAHAQRSVSCRPDQLNLRLLDSVDAGGQMSAALTGTAAGVAAQRPAPAQRQPPGPPPAAFRDAASGQSGAGGAAEGGASPRGFQPQRRRSGGRRPAGNGGARKLCQMEVVLGEIAVYRCAGEAQLKNSPERTACMVPTRFSMPASCDAIASLPPLAARIAPAIALQQDSLSFVATFPLSQE